METRNVLPTGSFDGLRIVAGVDGGQMNVLMNRATSFVRGSFRLMEAPVMIHVVAVDKGWITGDKDVLVLTAREEQTLEVLQWDLDSSKMSAAGIDGRDRSSDIGRSSGAVLVPAGSLFQVCRDDANVPATFLLVCPAASKVWSVDEHTEETMEKAKQTILGKRISDAIMGIVRRRLLPKQ